MGIEWFDRAAISCAEIVVLALTDLLNLPLLLDLGVPLPLLPGGFFTLLRGGGQ